jgi:hypothetical protein
MIALKFTAVLIIRFHYADSDPRFKFRFNYFKTAVLPTILAQRNQNFDIAIRCNPEHDALFTALSPRIRVFHVKNEGVNYIHGKNGKRYFHDHVSWNRIIDLPKYDIQIGLDSDDFIAPDYVAVIRKTCRDFHSRNLGASLHISFQPRKMYLKNKRTTGMMEYTPRRGSAFMALFQPNKGENYKFIYEMSHLNLWKLADKSVTIPSGHCMVTVHSHNESTR